jgi:uncharacterized protein (DUF427 family)
VDPVTLSIGTGPLAGHPGGEFNFSLEAAPKHRIFWADYAPRLRALVGGRPLFDTTRAKLLYETGILPVPYIPVEDFDHELLERTDRITHCPFKGEAAYWSIRGGAENAVWAYEDPKLEAAWLKDHAAVYWHLVDGWLIEEEPVFAHLRDPYHRVDVHESSRPVTVLAGGAVIARSARPKLLFETGLPTRVYVPRADIGALLTESETRTKCPYKGHSTYWSLPEIKDAGWSYEAPLAEASKIAGHVSFDGQGIEVKLGPPSATVPAPPPPADPA